jgi:DNA-binding NtrC family response regulator
MTVLKIKIGGSTVQDALVGNSDWLRQIRGVVRGVAAYPSTVMITGASGTGKELIARAIHASSPRAAKRFIPVDCASITGTLFASHMFGHVKGAFTGATHDALGCFRAADGGTIFLDEIGELEPELQAKLLRVLQERVVVPVGSHDGVPVNVRIVSATNRDLAEEVAAGRFREDLYYRLNVVALRTLPLRERPDDIEVLARHFLSRFAVENGMPLKQLSDAALARLLRYPWPGNVRELQNALERAVLFSHGEIISPDVLPLPSAEDQRGAADAMPEQPEPDGTLAEEGDRPRLGTPPTDENGPWPTAAEVECEHIRRTLEHTGYNQSAAARLLDMDRHQLRRRISWHGLDTSQSREGRPPLVSTHRRHAA